MPNRFFSPTDQLLFFSISIDRFLAWKLKSQKSIFQCTNFRFTVYKYSLWLKRKLAQKIKLKDLAPTSFLFVCLILGWLVFIFIPLLVCLFFGWFVYLLVYWFLCLLVYLFTSWLVYCLIYLFACLSSCWLVCCWFVNLFVCLSACWLFCLLLCLFAFWLVGLLFLFICLSVLDSLLTCLFVGRLFFASWLVYCFIYLFGCLLAGLFTGLLVYLLAGLVVCLFLGWWVFIGLFALPWRSVCSLSWVTCTLHTTHW